MTPRASRPPILCLVFLLVTWGTCPCVFAKMLGIGSEAAAEVENAQPAVPC